MPGETSSHLICDCIMIFKSSREMIWSVSLSVKYFPLGFLVSKSEQVLLPVFARRCWRAGRGDPS